MSDPLTTAAKLHPDLRWSNAFGVALYGVDDDTGRNVALFYTDAMQAIEVAHGGDVTHEEEHPGATLEALAAEAVDLRRAIGWPVGVAS